MGAILMLEIWCSMSCERNMLGIAIAIFYTRFLTTWIGFRTQDISLLECALSPQHSIYHIRYSKEDRSTEDHTLNVGFESRDRYGTPTLSGIVKIRVKSR